MTVQPYAIIRDEPIAIETPQDVAPVRRFERTSTNVLMATKFPPLPLAAARWDRSRVTPGTCYISISRTARVAFNPALPLFFLMNGFART